jgi:acyl-CoA synthetase (AMP-forming)/AMP-acid ligase II
LSVQICSISHFISITESKGFLSYSLDFLLLFFIHHPHNQSLTTTDATLEHCLNVAQANTIISTPDLAPFITGPRKHFTLSLYAFPTIQPPPPESNITLLTHSLLPLPSPIPPATKSSPADLSCLIFTSGTTGKPKACAIRNHLCILTAIPNSYDYFAPQKYFPLRTYSPLPLFHGTAFFTGIAYSIGNSGTLCLARKFSSSRFFKDVHDSRATRILYVGELCRYLLSSPPGEYDKKHVCKVAAGNGLRYEIWEKFKERFGIEEVREFYRSTEGVAKFDNVSRGAWGAGKVGFSGFYRRNFFDDDTVLIRVNPDSGELARDKKGFCIRAKIGEPGEVIGRVKNRELLTEYLGNEKATEEKIVRGVFKDGDIWQKMGDLLILEKEGWVRFHDRMGDTFRWKGENVSAGEVRDHIAKLEGVQDAVVFGVKLARYVAFTCYLHDLDGLDLVSV